MTDRAMSGDGSPACPFIAFEDERDERASSPDHRHRCYAEVRPAPRALAHQEAYCLSSAFPVCPTFQDWARREAARERAAGGRGTSLGAGASSTGAGRVADAGPAAEPGPAAGPDEPVPTPAAEADDDAEVGWAPAPTGDEPIVHRNPPRDWAAPPPWAGGTAAGGAGGRAGDERTPSFLASRAPSAGLAGSAADRMASGLPITPAESAEPAAPASDELAGLVASVRPAGAPRADAQPPIQRPPSGHYPTTSAAGRRPTVSSTRDRAAAAASEHHGPSWERARRYEAYPTIKTRAGLPGIPRLAVLAGALAVAALALFFLPAILGLGGGGTSAPSATPSTSASEASASPTITPVPEPTPQTYTIKKGDTLNKIAKKFGVTVDQLLAANKDTIKDANKIAVGDEIIIPVQVPDEVTDPNASDPGASPSP